eukprot:364456-Chlamydomonas_euryale.AAC.4
MRLGTAASTRRRRPVWEAPVADAPCRRCRQVQAGSLGLISTIKPNQGMPLLRAQLLPCTEHPWWTLTGDAPALHTFCRAWGRREQSGTLATAEQHSSNTLW